MACIDRYDWQPQTVCKTNVLVEHCSVCVFAGKNSIMTSMIKTLKFCNGIECPILGLGTWRCYGDEIYSAVKQALLNGYKHIDTAMVYQNEAQIGKAIQDLISESKISRKDVFVVTKLPGSCNQPNLVVPALKESLKNLNISYVDLYLMHTPIARAPLGPDVVSTDGKKDENGHDIYPDINPVDTWKEMEKCVEAGLARCVGVSNFNSLQLQAILDSCKIKPVTNQVECHPLLPQKKLRQFCKDNGILITSYRPLGGQKRKPADPNILDHEIVKEVAAKHGTSPSQILLRWHIQQGLIVLVKSSKLDHMLSNADIFDFSLTKEDMEALDKLESGHRYCPFIESASSKHYPFHAEF